MPKRKRTRQQIRASRANGARSQGPTTPAGLTRAALAPVTHALTANTVLLSNESQAHFEALLQSFVDHFQPANPAEYYCIEEMTWAKWRQRRAVGLESALLDQELDKVDPNHLSEPNAPPPPSTPCTPDPPASATSAATKPPTKIATAAPCANCSAYRRRATSTCKFQRVPRSPKLKHKRLRINNLPAIARVRSPADSPTLTPPRHLRKK